MLKQLFDYDDWANREEVRHLRSLAAPPQQAMKILAHIVGTERLWLGRLRQEKPAVVWPDLTLDQIAEQVDRLHDEWPREFGRSDVVEYVNSKGEKWSSRADDILMHVVIHGAYHRGQIATLVRQSGETPAYTDYIHCIRSAFIALRSS
ncbi:MAG TPA: DinB family protein [Thermoanaerobaculia bacterium]